MKPKVLFFPSAWSNHEIFLSQKTALEKNYEVVFPNIHQFKDIEKMADFVVNNYQETYCIIGLSMGGFIVQDILTRYPNFTSKAVLMGIYANAHNNEQKAFFNECIEKIKQGKLSELTSLYAEAVLSQEGFNNSELRNIVENFPLKLGAEVCINHHLACSNWKEHSASFKFIKTKTLVLAGEKDVAVPVSEVKKLADLIPHSKFEIILKAGHLMTLEQPIIVNQQLSLFLQQ
ncbi:MAG: hypothetical protein A3E87_02175 [Gammaproteobacteria bacterium RIFCSPHIGHO2_12_FULL_35_23]|nr:MAG: hypothetical protein A3E87_02175 [Gammaproteobacteria bacterium RIFCSPHIGHO2_12_FULL_35_23]